MFRKYLNQYTYSKEKKQFIGAFTFYSIARIALFPGFTHTFSQCMQRDCSLGLLFIALREQIV